jgi:hypothetical protein
MNVVGVVVLASPPHDPIRSKRHNGRRLRALHTYRATTTPPPRSSKVWWSGRWDQQHDGVVHMVESICGQGFAYAREVEEDRQKSSQTRARKELPETHAGNRWLIKIILSRAVVWSFYMRPWWKLARQGDCPLRELYVAQHRSYRSWPGSWRARRSYPASHPRLSIRSIAAAGRASAAWQAEADLAAWPSGRAGAGLVAQQCWRAAGPA